MLSAFGVEHEFSKAMTPNKAKGLERIFRKPDLTTTRGVDEYGYAADKLTAARKGKAAHTAPKAANPGGWMSANNRIAHQGKKASQRAKQFEGQRSGKKNRYFRKLP